MELQTIPLRDRSITAILDTRDGTYLVPLRPACESMKLGYTGQFERIKRNHWATIRTLRMVAEDGKEREMVALDRKTFTMWLATIVTTRIKDAASRETVEFFQLEAVDVLDRHFSSSQASTPIADPRLVQLELLGDLVRQQIENEQRFKALEAVAASAAAKADLAITTVTGSTDFLSVLGYCKTRGISIPEPKMAQAGKAATLICKLEGIEHRQSHHERWGSVGIYPITVLDRVFATHNRTAA